MKKTIKVSDVWGVIALIVFVIISAPKVFGQNLAVAGPQAGPINLPVILLLSVESIVALALWYASKIQWPQ